MVLFHLLMGWKSVPDMACWRHVGNFWLIRKCLCLAAILFLCDFSSIPRCRAWSVVARMAYKRR